jgi:hypothetical protein
VELSLPERFLGQVRNGQKVDFRVDAYPQERFTGEVYFISPQLDPGTRTALVKARVANPETRLRGGMLAQLDLSVRLRESALVIPEPAVIANGDIVDPEDARAVLAATGADALMIGRGAFGRPWLFREIAHFLATGNVLPAPDAREWSEIVLAHLDDIHAFHGEQAGVRFARKHIGWYVHGMPGGEVLRDQVNTACTIAAQRAAVEAWCAVLQARERRGVAPAPVASRPVYNNHRTSAGRERPRLEEIHR